MRQILRSITARQLAEGERLPRGYGVAYLLPYSHRAVLAPLGVHLLMGWARALYFWLIQTRVVEAWEGYSAYQYAKGFDTGVQHGYQKGLQHARMLFDHRQP